MEINTKNWHNLSEAAKDMADIKMLYRIYHNAKTAIAVPGMQPLEFIIDPGDITALKQEFLARRTSLKAHLDAVNDNGGEDPYVPE